MNTIILPESYNYIGVFLTLRCNLKCDYCINAFNGEKKYTHEMTAREWVEGLRRMRIKKDVPITLQGGEPTLHKDFYIIANAIKQCGYNVDLMTNAMFNEYEFVENIHTNIFKREAPYASIRVSYHPSQQDYSILQHKVLFMQSYGYSIGIWSVLHPSVDIQHAILFAKEQAEARGIDFRTKEFLGVWNGKKYGKYKYSSAIKGHTKRKVQCKTTELLIGPDGSIYRCHADLYAGRTPIGHILDENFQVEDVYRPCDRYGECNPCDVKIKTNRFQIDGHTSVDIKEIEG